MPNLVLPYSKNAMVTLEIRAILFASSILMVANLGQFRKRCEYDIQLGDHMHMKDFNEMVVEKMLVQLAASHPNSDMMDTGPSLSIII